MNDVASSHRIVTIAAGASLSEAIDASGARFGAVRIPSAWDAANLYFHAAEHDVAASGVFGADDAGQAPAATYALVRDKTGAIVKISGIQTGEAGWYEIPAQVLTHKAFKLRSTNTGSDAAAPQSVNRSIVVVLKS